MVTHDVLTKVATCKRWPRVGGPGWVAERNRKYMYMRLAYMHIHNQRPWKAGLVVACIESHPVRRCVSANTSPHQLYMLG